MPPTAGAGHAPLRDRRRRAGRSGPRARPPRPAGRTTRTQRPARPPRRRRRPRRGRRVSRRRRPSRRSLFTRASTGRDLPRAAEVWQPRGRTQVRGSRWYEHQEPLDVIGMVTSDPPNRSPAPAVPATGPARRASRRVELFVRSDPRPRRSGSGRESSTASGRGRRKGFCTTNPRSHRVPHRSRPLLHRPGAALHRCGLRLWRTST